MNMADFAALLLGSWIVIGFAVWVFIRRTFPPLDPSLQDEANRAVVDVVVASLKERPDQWKITPLGLVHAAGTEITRNGSGIFLTHGGARSLLPEHLANEVIRAVQVRNARMMLRDIGGEKNEAQADR